MRPGAALGAVVASAFLSARGKRSRGRSALTPFLSVREGLIAGAGLEF